MLHQIEKQNRFKTMLPLTSVVITGSIQGSAGSKGIGKNVAENLIRMNDNHVTANMKQNEKNL
jgi:hypothetical protein